MEQPQVSKEEQIGHHKGSIATLFKEREELVKVIQKVEVLIQAHVQALKELGVDLEAELKKAAEAYKKAQEAQAAKKPGENIAHRLG